MIVSAIQSQQSVATKSGRKFKASSKEKETNYNVAHRTLQARYKQET